MLRPGQQAPTALLEHAYQLLQRSDSVARRADFSSCTFENAPANSRTNKLVAEQHTHPWCFTGGVVNSLSRVRGGLQTSCKDVIEVARMQAPGCSPPRQFETLLSPAGAPWIKRSLHRRAHRVTNPGSRESSRSLSDRPGPTCVIMRRAHQYNWRNSLCALLV